MTTGETQLHPPALRAICGSLPGYRAHRNNGEETCPERRAALAAYQSDYRKHHERADNKGRNRAVQRARSRAQTRLAQQHPEDFRRLFYEELDREDGKR